MQELTVAVISFAYINGVQDSVATQLRCGGRFNKHVIESFPRSVPVTDFPKIGQYVVKMWTKVWWHVCFGLTVYINVQ